MVCDNCGENFTAKKRHTARNKHFYCSPECGWAAKIKKKEVICDWCKKPMMKKQTDIARTAHNFCGRGCYLDFINIEKAGAVNQRVCGQVLYRYFAEKELGRELLSSEEVHHKDNNHGNNNPQNLVVLTKSEHSVIHATTKRRGANGRFIKQG
jgi:hypothetical protein